jgi:hypothetical protein
VPEVYSCTYELRRGQVIISTGRLTLDEPPNTGRFLNLGQERLRIVQVLPAANGELHLVLETL